jgi:hypothetical protein
MARCSPIRGGPREFTADQYFTTQAEMAERFADLPGALANSVAIAQRCNLTIPVGKNYLPDFPTPPGVTLDEHLKREAASGLEARLEILYPDPCRSRIEARRISRAPPIRDEDHRADGLRRLLPDRRRLHQLGKAKRRSRRSRPGFGRRGRSSPTRSASPTSIRCATVSSSSGCSTPSGSRCRTSTSTSARTGATA